MNMRTKKAYSYLSMSVAVLMLSGCATAGAGSNNVSMQTTVEQTHRMVQNMEEDLTRSVNSLSNSTADIVARMNATEQQMRTLITLSEENRRNVAQLQASIDELIRVTYQRQGLTPPPGGVVNPPITVIPGQPGIGTVTPPLPGATVTSPVTPIPGQPLPPTVLPPAVDVSMITDQHYRAAQTFYAKGEYSSGHP